MPPFHHHLVLLFLPFLTSALPLAQQDDPEDIPSGGIGYDPSAQGDDNVGSAGADTGAVTLSKGAIIAISVVAAVVVIGGITTAVLFYLAKKRQWRVAATLRKSVKRVGTGLTRVMTPRTPHKMTFSPIEKSRSDPLLPSSTPKSTNNSTPERPSRAQTHGSAEKTLAAVSEQEGRDGRRVSREDLNMQKNKKKSKSKRPTPPPVQVPQSKFEMDSPKTPLWSKVFGR